MLKKLNKFLKQRKKEILIISGLSLFYLITHLIALTKLPVFSDEAIYIRWAQLIMDDWQRYLFFPMNDGKTPFFFWLLVPFQYIFTNQLFAARVVSVFVGLIQIFVISRIVGVLGGSKKSQYLSAFLVTILPFWYFHHRMALVDGLLTLFLSISYLFLLNLFRGKKNVDIGDNLISSVLEKKNLILTMLAGLFFGLGMFTKTPAILFVPTLYFSILFTKKLTKKSILSGFLTVSLAVGVGLAMFISLSLSATFSQLFNVGSGFLFPINEFFESSKWKDTIPNFPTYIFYFVSYLTPTLLIFSFFGLFSKYHKRSTHILFWSGILFFLPIALLGKVVYPRYLFPAALFFTLSGVMGIESFYKGLMVKSDKLWAKFLSVAFVSVLLSNAVGSSVLFIQKSMMDVDAIPFVSADISQYLTKWSSGHGIVETVEMIRDKANNSSVAVGTEGSFGTLPDGLNMYLHQGDLENIYVEGIGFPVDNITQKFADRAAEFDNQWIVVNSNRMEIDLDKDLLLAEYCRPFNSSCLQVWDITSVFSQVEVEN